MAADGKPRVGMRLIIIGSGSSGNCYVLTDGNESLVIEAGVRFLEVKKALGFNVRSIKGVIVSHRHGDHAAYAHEYESAGIPVWKPYESESLRQRRVLGGFRVSSFEAVHDVPCCGFLIEHPGIGRMLYASDTEYIRYTFKDLSTILLEANYSDKYIDRTAIKYRHAITGHMSIDTCLGCIKANQGNALAHVILCHLSADGADPEEFKGLVRAITNPWVTVDVAAPGLVVDIEYIF